MSKDRVLGPRVNQTQQGVCYIRINTRILTQHWTRGFGAFMLRLGEKNADPTMETDQEHSNAKSQIEIM